MRTTIKISLYTPITPDHNKYADDHFRNIGDPIRLYTPNISISAKRDTLEEAHDTIRGFFRLGGYDSDLVKINKILINHKGGTKIWER